MMMINIIYGRDRDISGFFLHHHHRRRRRCCRFFYLLFFRVLYITTTLPSSSSSIPNQFIQVSQSVRQPNKKFYISTLNRENENRSNIIILLLRIRASHAQPHRYINIVCMASYFMIIHQIGSGIRYFLVNIWVISLLVGQKVRRPSL